MQGRTPESWPRIWLWSMRCRWCCVVALVVALGPVAYGQQPIHYFQNAYLPPGEVARAQAYRGGVLYGYLQPVHVTAPRGTLISIAEEGVFGEAAEGELHVALQVGQVYRLRVSNIPGSPELEVFPSIEVLNRLHPPEGQKLRFPVPIQLTEQDLLAAIDGLLVTRVIYLEEPRAALPAAEDPAEQRYLDVPPEQDPLLEADRLGRPMAILRMGSRIPDFDPNLERFTFESPPFVRYKPPTPAPNVEPGDRALEQGFEGQMIPRVPLNQNPIQHQSQYEYDVEGISSPALPNYEHTQHE